MTDPVLRALEDANPVSEADYADLPPLGPLPRRGVPARRALACVAAAAAIVLAVVALAPPSTPAGDEILQRAFALPAAGPEVLYWRVRTESPRLPPFTDDVWIHVRSDGTLDAIHERRLDGAYAGQEAVLRQPYGVGDLRDAETTDRARPGAPVRRSRGVGYPDIGLAEVVAAAQKAARGELDVGKAKEVSYAGRDAYEIRVRDATGPETGARRTPSELAVTLWIDRHTNAPLAIRWGDGDEWWQTESVQRFSRLADDPRLFELG